MGRVRKKCDWCGGGVYADNQNDFSVKNSVIGWAAGMQDKHNFCSKRCKHDFDASNSSQPREEHSEYNYDSNNSDDEGVTLGDIGVFIKRMIVVLGLLWLLYSYLTN